MNLLFVVNSLGSGGAEKIFMDMINNFDYSKHSVTVAMVDHFGIYVTQLPKEVKKKFIFEHVSEPVWKKRIYGAVSVFGTYLLRKVSPEYFYKHYISGDYDVEIAFLEGEATSLVAQSKNTRSVKYAWVHTDMIKNPWTKKCYKNFEQEKKAYKKYDRVLAVSESVKDAFEKKFGLPAQVIYNALDEREIERKTDMFECEPKEEDMIRLVSIGRLEKVKGYERLIEAVAELVQENFNVELLLVGDGSERTNLEKLIKEKKVEDRVKLLGFKENPYPYLKSADLFVCSSYAEGFSTVVTEALILGIPTVTTECAGMRELLGDSEYGLIVDNSTQGLVDGLRKILSDSKLLEEYRTKAKERGKAFCVADRIKDIEALFEQDYQKKRTREEKKK